MKNLLLLFLCAAAVISAGASEIFFVPGWNTGYHNRIGCVVRLEKVFPGIPVKVKSWDSKVLFYPTAKKNAEKYSKVLAQEILNMPEKKRRQLILVGHSLGGKIVINVLNTLAEKSLSVHKAVLLGAAIERDDPAIRKALFAVRTRILNLYNPDDDLLLLEGDMLGSSSWKYSHPRFLERRSEKRPSSVFNHYAYLYIEDLLKFKNELTPLYSKIKLPGEKPGILKAKKVNVDDFYWQTEKESCHWLLQRHYLGGKFRITDPWDRLRFESSDHKEAMAVFDSVCRQLEAIGAK